jgi:hypothetical protein
MPDKYYPPQFRASNFHCPYCHVYADQTWQQIYVYGGVATKFFYSTCAHCRERAVWHENGNLLFPLESSIPMPSPDLPDDCKIDYMEAREVYPYSPRSSAALLRLCIQKLLLHLGEKGSNINDDIAALVKKGLSPLVQQSLDICRVVGNNAVHPGEISVEDTSEIAFSLFDLVNYVTEDRITRPRQIQDLYTKLPDGALKAIEKRDSG